MILASLLFAFLAAALHVYICLHGVPHLDQAGHLEAL